MGHFLWTWCQFFLHTTLKHNIQYSLYISLYISLYTIIEFQFENINNYIKWIKGRKFHRAIVFRQIIPYKRKEGYYIYFEDNAGVTVNPGSCKQNQPWSCQHGPGSISSRRWLWNIELV